MAVELAFTVPFTLIGLTAARRAARRHRSSSEISLSAAEGWSEPAPAYEPALAWEPAPAYEPALAWEPAPAYEPALAWEPAPAYEPAPAWEPAMPSTAPLPMTAQFYPNGQPAELCGPAGSVVAAMLGFRELDHRAELAHTAMEHAYSSDRAAFSPSWPNAALPPGGSGSGYLL
jgi:hypothetical protein